jgi:hypothetical protein
MPKEKLTLAVIGSLGTLATSAFWIQPASAQSAADISRQVINDAIQNNLQTIRDQLQSQRTLAPGSVQPMRFTDEQNLIQNEFDDMFGPLGYAKSPMLTKASPAMPPPPPPPQWAVWGTGSGDWQRSTVAGITSRASTGSGVGGIDWTKIGIFTSSDALVIGADGAGSFTHVNTGTNVTTPAVGAYIAYINGGFSADFSFLAAFSDTDLGTVSTVAGIGSTIRTDAYSYTGDLNYRFDIPYAWWIEPTVGLTYTNTFFVNEPGAATGEIVTWQGGARVGTEWVLANGLKVQPTFTGLAYSNTTEKAGGLPGAPISFVPPGLGIPGAIAGAAGTDRGQVWGKGQAKFNFVFNNQFSAYIQGVIRGTNGTLDALGGGVEVGARYVF